MSSFEVIAIGVSRNINALAGLDEEQRRTFIVDKARALWENPNFINNSGAGVRGTTRLSNLLPMGAAYFQP